ncbi:DUF192 domain-containing protein [Tranquillimonas rosea]|uniref:DUF192 domain-containing protein n=1 Tax=Tranquillimonas rosea TaxID=641238 RepID=UPI003BAA29F6
MGSRSAAALVTVAAMLAAGSGMAEPRCSDDLVQLRGDWGRAQFGVEVADDPGERAKGLMGREILPRSRGMLFVYEEAGPASFWMRNTLIPLDMLFIGPDGTVDRIHRNAEPLDETPIPGGDNVKFVLEINGGLSRALGIDEGSEILHPAVDPDAAAWPCAAS